jgi:hypothetical protein
MFLAMQLNPIANTQPMASPTMRALFSLDQQEMDKQDQLQYEALQAAGTEHETAMAYQLTAPLLVENKAISRYISRTGNSHLRLTLPEVVNVQEAVSLATLEYRLTSSQQTDLAQMLRRLLP